ncbi:MAG: hypothetical protein PHC62_03870 [Candidatus Izemoplasmatales bacterium]|nr:hypothetical protein [Candidatus Izemoplasmatales bacterium]
MDKAKEILLSQGAFYVDETAALLTRGGGKLLVEKTMRNIAADGDRGPVKGRVSIDDMTVKLEMNILEVLVEDLDQLYVGVKKDETQTDRVSYTGKFDIDDSEYKTVKWVGKTKTGKPIQINIMNAINTENIDWTLVEKGEIISKLTYVGHYEEGSEEVPYKVTFGKAKGTDLNTATTSNAQEEGA